MVAASVMALVVSQLSDDFDVWLAMTFTQQISQLIFCISAGCASYFLVVFLLGIRFDDFKVKS